MSVAIAITPRQEVAGHFGKAAVFMIYDRQGQCITEMVNEDPRAVGCKHKKLIQRQLVGHGVTEIILGNVGQRSLARLLAAGFAVYRVPGRTPLAAVLNGDVQREALVAAEQGRPCKREKGGCGCGCGSKKSSQPAKIKIGMKATGSERVVGLPRMGGFKL
ncbi:NifB/NifX family molybdenum-iron cluster-binding protein [Photobacterium nomapromontoriensis]|uniref:NifB/NifX family molybdenum-iron cluster-binding protein n=1 Tax=Photobacterium nomapromontoriensis TaxID=2910237 RepID=UPI003D10A3F8